MDTVWQPDVYVGSHKKKSIVKEDGRTVKCSSRKFNNYICMPSADVELLFKHCLKVEK